MYNSITLSVTDYEYISARETFLPALKREIILKKLIFSTIEKHNIMLN
jgi:hypothetical protein